VEWLESAPRGLVAQLVEHSTENRGVTGSNPVRATTYLFRGKQPLRRRRSSVPRQTAASPQALFCSAANSRFAAGALLFRGKQPLRRRRSSLSAANSRFAAGAPLFRGKQPLRRRRSSPTSSNWSGFFVLRGRSSSPFDASVRYPSRSNAEGTIREPTHHMIHYGRIVGRALDHPCVDGL
jgi:hypothetical protein